MEIAISNHFVGSHISVRPWSNSRKAWHLFSLLLTTGRPATSSELAYRCTSFPATAEIVEFLSCIPKSPISLTDDLYVTVSFQPFASSAHFSSFLSQIIRFASSVSIRVRMPKWPWEISQITLQAYFRKRKRMSGGLDAISSTPKRAMLEPMYPAEENKDSEEDQVSTSIAGRSCRRRSKDSVSSGACTPTSSNCTKSLPPEDPNEAMTKIPLALDNVPQPCIYDCPISSNALHQGVIDTDVSSKAKDYSVQEAQTKAFEMESCSNGNNGGMSAKELEQSEFEAQLLRNWLEIINEYQVPPNQLNNNVSVLPTVQKVNDGVCYSVESKNVGDFNHDGSIKTTETRRFDPSTETKEVEMFMFSDNVSQLGKSVGGDLKEIDQQIGSGMGPLSSHAKSDARNMTKPMVSTTTEVPEIPMHTAQLPSGKESFSGSPPNATPEVVLDSLDCIKLTNAVQETQSVIQDQKLNPTLEKIAVGTTDKLNAQRGTNSMKHCSDERELPYFELFTVEEEEGSGGYGTVYRAQRKSDGVRVAIKCPHKNAHRHHVNNEKRMLDRFGGKHFIIRCMGSFKKEDSDCFVLQHVEHDRPEVLKREIDIFELQWYGFCMFNALESLHKQGVVHRDVKPGNFLFSRTMVKGYLIDFNLALDLRWKLGDTKKPKEPCPLKSSAAITSIIKPGKPNESKKLPNPERKAITKERIKDGKPFKSNNRKKENKQPKHMYPDFGTSIRSQGAEGSGITSTKDGTSTKTPSGDRLKEPIPCHGRKELINMVQQALHNSINQPITAPSAKRKRVTAVPEDYKLNYLTPMPLNLADLNVARGGFVKRKGPGKYNKEGPCVGTKGFRAPEVLLRSGYQCPKVDIWSAGVTLLYLMIGRTPFTGDPEQNMKEIAKLKGSEELWEVAKLHDREASFPKELYDIQWLPSPRLKDWCKGNTRRPKFLELIPNTLFDLVDKCLTVNPRQRISAEEALNHEYFNMCREKLKKPRLHS